MDDFLKAHDFAEKWGISVRQVELMCQNKRIKDVQKFGAAWAIPKDTPKPEDLRKAKNRK
jgi:hypothetical protein